MKCVLCIYTHLEQWAAGEQSWTSCRSRDSQPWVTLGFKSNALSIRPTTAQDVSCFAHGPWFGHVLVFILCEHLCLVSMCSHVYCLDQTHVVTSLLVKLLHLLSLITLIIYSPFILLVFVVLCQFVVICSLVVSLSCPAFSRLGAPFDRHPLGQLNLARGASEGRP